VSSGQNGINDEPAGPCPAGLAFLGVSRARVKFEAPGAPRDLRTGDIYFQPGHGPEESRAHYLEACGFPERWANGGDWVIGELGFGAGLNFLTTWQAWQGRSAPFGHLTYIGVEAFPLCPDDLVICHESLGTLEVLAARLRTVWPPAVKGMHRLSLGDDVTLLLWLMPVEEALGAMTRRADAWYLDGFAPAANPAMWTPQVLAHIGRLSAPSAIASSFTVAGSVRRGLAEAGFVVEKREGFGRKRQRLEARFAAGLSTVSPSPKPRTLAIVGGGIAGACLAIAARRAGLEVTLIHSEDQHDGDALPAASFNPAALVMPRLDKEDTPLARFHRIAFVFAEAFYRSSPELWHACGVELREAAGATSDKLGGLCAGGALPLDWLLPTEGGVFLPKAGVLDAAAFCQRAREGARVLSARVNSVAEDDDQAVLCIEGSARALAFDRIILAGGVEGAGLHPMLSEFLRGSAGQVGWTMEAQCEHAVCDGRYLAPLVGGRGTIFGATHRRWAEGDALPGHYDTDIDSISAIYGALSGEKDAPGAPQYRASVRATTPDRQPICGPLADLNTVYDWAAPLAKGQATASERPASGRLFALTGLGSRGFTLAPLLAHHLIDALMGRPGTLEQPVAEVLDPARFAIRAVRRGQLHR
jgi:tRNA 5-methylaminomethyl-2-thiouridine biosynthesis bifunctional protein